jgi:hypothetical protein
MKKDKRFTREEFKAMFPGSDKSESEILQDYQSFLQIIEQLDQTTVPELSTREKADIFRHAWIQSSPARSKWSLVDAWRRLAVTFVLGLALGCVAMAIYLRPHDSQAAPTNPVLAVESLGPTQTYTGKTLQSLYPDIENPRLVLEKANQNSDQRRVLYGTLDEGNVYVVWNL